MLDWLAIFDSVSSGGRDGEVPLAPHPDDGAGLDELDTLDCEFPSAAQGSTVARLDELDFLDGKIPPPTSDLS